MRKMHDVDNTDEEDTRQILLPCRSDGDGLRQRGQKRRAQLFSIVNHESMGLVINRA